MGNYRVRSINTGSGGGRTEILSAVIFISGRNITGKKECEMISRDG